MAKKGSNEKDKAAMAKKTAASAKSTLKKPLVKKEPAKGIKPPKAKEPAKVKEPAKKAAGKNVRKKKDPIKDAVEAYMEEKTVGNPTLFTEYDIYLFKEGKHYSLYEKFGPHLMEYQGQQGTYFAVWAPNAQYVSVIGDFNKWDRDKNKMAGRRDGSGIWEIFIPEAGHGSMYKYFIHSHNHGYKVEKGDPFALQWEIPPETASIVWNMQPKWNDREWMDQRQKKTGKSIPYAVYEMHIGSWMRVKEDGYRSLSYRELADKLPAYIEKMGFTHVEFMPVMEHPFFGSWGYQITGYFAPSSRFGTPEDFMFLIDALHQKGIGVILDWVPSHYPSDEHGLHYFDGTHLYEHADPRKGYHPDWKSYIFNYGRNEVRAFLISNALFWLDRYHADGLRVDAVASMLYLDYSRKEGEWEPNEFGGRENLEAISLLKEFNEAIYEKFPDVHTIAEESTSWPMVSKPTYLGGLGFGMKWMMGWMHDTLQYFKKDPLYRQHHQNEITFSIYYAFTENFMLPLSHDEVVYGKRSLLNKMPGDEWQKFANLRTLYAYMYAHPGAKLLFMGAEFAQISEWDHDGSLEWHLGERPLHSGIQQLLIALNSLYKTERALYDYDFEEKGFEWIDINDSANSIITFLRKGKNSQQAILVVCNFTPVPRQNYRVGVPLQGQWREILNTDDETFGGSNVKNPDPIYSEALPTHSKENSITLITPPLGVCYFKYEGR